MKKLERLKIYQLQEFTRIGEHEQMAMKGGYTPGEMEEMMNEGTWEGGVVDGMGYVGSGVTVYGDGTSYWKSEGRWDMDGCVGCVYGQNAKPVGSDPKGGIAAGTLLRHFFGHRKYYYGHY